MSDFGTVLPVIMDQVHAEGVEIPVWKVIKWFAVCPLHLLKRPGRLSPAVPRVGVVEPPGRGVLRSRLLREVACLLTGSCANRLHSTGNVSVHIPRQACSADASTVRLLPAVQQCG